jgi:integrase
VDRTLEVNPVVGTKRPRVVKPQHSTWTGSQLRTFLSALPPEDRWAPLWVLAAATGMRRGELLALRWSEVDLENGVIAVERSVTQIRQNRVYVTPKNHERRDVNIDPRTVDTLTAWRKVQVTERLTWGAAYRGAEDLLITWDDGRPVLPDYTTKTFGTMTERLEGLPRPVLHGRRHTHATILFRDGVPVHIVAKGLGHRDPSVTLNVYADAIPDDGRAVDVLSRRLGPLTVGA